MERNILWQDTKRPFLGLPLSFTHYILTDTKLLVQTGFLNRKEEEIRLYRIMDITLKASLAQRMFGIGTIHCCSADKTTPEFDIACVKKPQQVKDQLSDLVETARKSQRVGLREFMDDDGEDGGEMAGPDQD